MVSGRSIFFLLPDCETMRQRDNGFYKYYTQNNIQYKSLRNALSRCHTVTRGIESIVCTSPNYEESIGQSRSDNGVVTGKTAEKQGKCTLGLFPRAYSCLTPYALHYKQSKRTCTTVFIKAILSWRCLGFVPCPLRLRCIALISLWHKWTAINYGRRTTRNPMVLPRLPGEPLRRKATRQ